MQTLGGFQDPPLSTQDGLLIYSSWANQAKFRFNKLAGLNLIYLFHHASVFFITDVFCIGRVYWIFLKK